MEQQFKVKIMDGSKRLGISTFKTEKSFLDYLRKTAKPRHVWYIDFDPWRNSDEEYDYEAGQDAL